MAVIARARPWLGTVVEVRVGGLAPARALAAIEAAFAEVAGVHRLMSFHDAGSDLSRLHRAGARAIVRVDARTWDVLGAACGIAEESDGRFDPTIAPRLVERGLLPRPVAHGRVPARGTWRDIELLPGHRVRLRRPLWIDLGGIAKGHAVDRALARLRASGASTASVNAGGDLARFGATPQLIALRHGDAGDAPSIELGDAALATSVVAPRAQAAHVNPRDGRTPRARRAVSVLAGNCMIADALTKVVLADVRAGERLLRRHRASACLRDGAGRWRLLGAA